MILASKPKHRNVSWCLFFTMCCGWVQMLDNWLQFIKADMTTDQRRGDLKTDFAKTTPSGKINWFIEGLISM